MQGILVFFCYDPGADPTIQDGNRHTADEYTEIESIRKLINANKVEVFYLSN